MRIFESFSIENSGVNIYVTRIMQTNLIFFYFSMKLHENLFIFNYLSHALIVHKEMHISRRFLIQISGGFYLLD